MRRLLLIRHAKSSWKYPDLSDHDRPLNKRGQRDVVAMSAHLQTKGKHLDAVFSSSAARAKVLADAISTNLQLPLYASREWYTFSASELLERIRGLPDECLKIAVVTHNPAVTRLSNQLTDAGISNIPTSGMLSMSFDCRSWEQVGSSNAKAYLEFFEYPKMLY